MALGIESDEAVADQGAGGLEPLGRGELLPSPGPPPESDHRAHGRVKRPVRLAGKCLGPGQNLPQIVTNRYGFPLSGGTAEAPQLALRIVIA